MNYKKIIAITLLFLLTVHCENNKKEDLIEGLPLSGDKNTDLLLLLAATNTGIPCDVTIGISGTTFAYSGSRYSVCANTATTGTISFPTSGNYKVSVSAGRQTLSSSNCTSRNFTFNVILKDNTTELISSASGSKSETLTLSTGKNYTIDNDGLVSASSYQCNGLTPSSRVTNFQITFEKQ
ncbi:hypothetical protein JWG40_00200 [Leptospira sp. 201903074]|uniref:hypothetical protein n=1 Tax=Leptospira abararensis TaxID=2810036 RepID=UPI0019659E0E|nr:hypothetical protein [Leptospira abararensis]MBM9545421.1 hypothetical protein [Leptospira abararensis]